MTWTGSTRSARLPADWTERRAACLARDQHTCQACGGTRCGNRNLQVDHIRAGDDHRLTNLQTLGDDPCHRAKSAAEGNMAQGQGPMRRRPNERHPGVR